MTEPHHGIQSESHNHGVQEHGHHEHPPLPFTEADIATFRQEDVHAGKMVVLLMTGIFTVGVVLYTLVALSTWPAVTT